MKEGSKDVLLMPNPNVSYGNWTPCCIDIKLLLLAFVTISCPILKDALPVVLEIFPPLEFIETWAKELELINRIKNKIYFI